MSENQTVFTRTPSALFVGRKQELQAFQDVLQMDCPFRFLTIHSDGEGGIGKTQLLLQMQAYCESHPEITLFTKEFVDFYQTESRTHLGVMRQIVSNLGKEHFSEFNQQMQAYQETSDQSERQELFTKVETTFQKEFAIFSENTSNEKFIVLFFDTYEAIPGTEIIRNGKKRAEITVFSHWLETQFFPGIATPKTRIVISGRYPLRELDPAETLSINLSTLSFADTQDFWKRRFSQNPDTKLTDKKLTEYIGGADLVKIFYALADGRPVLLALFADWMQYYNLSPQELLQEIETCTATKITQTEKITKAQRDLFEEELIKRIADMKDPEDKAVRFMAVVHRRMTPEMFQTLADIQEGFKFTQRSLEELNKENIHPAVLKVLMELGKTVFRKKEDVLNTVEKHVGKELKDAYKELILKSLNPIPSLEQCRNILLTRLKPLSFIKYKTGDIVLLHDEMRRLVVQYWWDKPYRVYEDRKEICQKAVAYYEQYFLADENIPEEARETYTSELLEYAYLADPGDGLERFRYEFDIALEDGKADYADLLLREAETYHQRYPYTLPFPDFLQISLRRARYSMEIEGKYADAKQIIDAILTQYQHDQKWQFHPIYGHFLLLQGQIALQAGDYATATPLFKQAKAIFYEAGEDALSARASNWIGLVCYRQGDFKEAERCWIQSQKIFSVLLEQAKKTERERRRLIQGIHYAFGNLALNYRHTGRFDYAITYAEIVLNIARQMQRNRREIALARITTAHILEFAGRAIDARHHALEAEKLLQQMNNRMLSGRLKTIMCLLQYHTKELTYLLEYYRAGEIYDIVQNLKFVEREDIRQAGHSIKEAIKLLEHPTPMLKDLADAYYASGELYMVSPDPAHWEHAEQAFLHALDWGRKSQFLYRVVDTLESLVTLYYFWNVEPGLSEAQRTRNLQESRKYQAELDTFDFTKYPNLFGKYQVTSGDMKFDEALDLVLLTPEAAIVTFKDAFMHYVNAAELMQFFSQERFYLTLRVFYNRLNTIINTLQEQQLPLEVFDRFREQIAPIWRGKSPEFEQIFQHVQLRIKPHTKFKQIAALHQELQSVLKKGDFAVASLLNSCLIDAYTTLIAQETDDDFYREQRILCLNAQSGYYRTLADEYQAIRCIWASRRELQKGPFRDDNLVCALEGYTKCCEGTLLYRQGEYGRLLEFYLQDELAIGREKFDHQFPEKRDQALELLQKGEKQIFQALDAWKQQRENALQNHNRQEMNRLESLIQRHRKNLGETRFRLGELHMLNEEFVGDHGALTYLQQAVDDAKESGDSYRCADAMQSYLNALYFSGKYDDTHYKERRSAYEAYFEEKVHSPESSDHYPSIIGRLRIVQGDRLFSEYFERHEELSPTGELQRMYLPTKGKANTRILRTLLRYYVEACNFMAQHSLTNFAAATRVLRRRIELLADRNYLQEIQRCLSDVWGDQNFLAEKHEELELFIEFIKIRSMMLEDEAYN